MAGERPLCLNVAHMSSHGPDDETCSICGREIGRFTPADEPDLEIPTVETPKPYILWIYTPCEGYSRNDCDSLEDCYKTALGMCASDFTITGPPINVGFIELNEQGETQ